MFANCAISYVCTCKMGAMDFDEQFIVQRVVAIHTAVHELVMVLSEFCFIFSSIRFKYLKHNHVNTYGGIICRKWLLN